VSELAAAAVALDTRSRVLDAIRTTERFVLVSHEHPDGDALGSLVAMQGVLRALGKDSVIAIAPEEFPLPQEYRFFALDGLCTAAPADLDRRTAIFLDCGNLDRNPMAALRDAEPLLNLDHHHDNTRFGTINHVVEEASCTAEIIWDLMPGLGVALTPQIAEALYVGLVTDTGRFSYENTTPRAHRMAGELIDAGVDVARIYRQIYEGVALEKLELLARALASIVRYDEGRVTVATLRAEDFAATGAEDSHSEGIIDQLRTVAGTKVAVLVRDVLTSGRRGARKVSLRATDDEVDVSAIARQFGGGGHRRAAGFSSDLETAELVSAIRAQI
jgi:bifunctional oligoribonuclease and PAP phosphatase NrnA